MWIHFLPTFHLMKPLTFIKESIYDENDSTEGLNKSECKELLPLATRESQPQHNNSYTRFCKVFPWSLFTTIFVIQLLYKISSYGDFMKLLGFFSLLVSLRDPGSYSYFPLLKLVFFYRRSASMENFCSLLQVLLIIIAVMKPVNEKYRKFETGFQKELNS